MILIIFVLFAMGVMAISLIVLVAIVWFLAHRYMEYRVPGEESDEEMDDEAGNKNEGSTQLYSRNLKV